MPPEPAGPATSLSFCTLRASGGVVVARLQQPPRAQQAADVVRPERWCGPAHGTSSDGWKGHEPIRKAGVAVTTATADGPELVAEDRRCRLLQHAGPASMAVTPPRIERRRDQPSPPFDFAAWMARQTRSGVVGMPMSVIPSGDSASITALTTAGGEPMVPA